MREKNDKERERERGKSNCNCGFDRRQFGLSEGDEERKRGRRRGRGEEVVEDGEEVEEEELWKYIKKLIKGAGSVNLIIAINGAIRSRANNPAPAPPPPCCLCTAYSNTSTPPPHPSSRETGKQPTMTTEFSPCYVMLKFGNSAHHTALT